MKQGTVKYSQEFISPTGLKRWIGIEYPINFDSEDPIEVVGNVKRMVENSYNALESSGSLTQAAPATEVYVDRGNPKWTLENDINSCAELKVLETYKLLVKGNDYLQAAYDKKLAELKK